jgi:hypothetical protein
MGISGALIRLEARAKAVLRCDWCRYALHDTPPSKQKKYAADPRSHIQVQCPYCGTEFSVDVSRCDGHEREATVLYYKQGHGAVYRDERVFAATQWLIQRGVLKRWRSGDLDKEKVEARQRAKAQNLNQRRNEQIKEDRYIRERAEIRERAYSFVQRMHENEEEKYAPHTFPLAAEVEGIEKPDSHGYIPGSYKKMEFGEVIARKVLYSARVMQACERVLWGGVQPDTQTAIVELGSLIEGFEEERERRALEEEVRKAREAEDRRRREEERQAQPTPTERSPSRFWKRPAEGPPVATSLSPLTPSELRLRVERRFACEPDFEGHNLTLFMIAKAQCDSERMMDLANVPDEERRRRGFSWDDDGGSPPINGESGKQSRLGEPVVIPNVTPRRR